MNSLRPGRGAAQFQIRLTHDLRDRLAAEAEKNGRSMNAEIVARLTSSFEVDADEFARNNAALADAIKSQSQMQAMMSDLIRLLEEANERAAKREKNEA